MDRVVGLIGAAIGYVLVGAGCIWLLWSMPPLYAVILVVGGFIVWRLEEIEKAQADRWWCDHRDERW